MWYRFSKKKYDSAIVALWLSPDDVKKIKINHKNIDWEEKDTPSEKDEFHITLMYLGDLVDIKKDRDTIEKLIENICADFKFVEITLGGIVKFYVKSELSPVAFTINSPQIESLRTKLLESMGKIGIKEPEGSPSFVPHMTLGYAREDFDTNSVDVKNDTIKINDLALSWGGEIKRFKLG
jgi:2'-5' RNA ligase